MVDWLRWHADTVPRIIIPILAVIAPRWPEEFADRRLGEEELFILQMQGTNAVDINAQILQNFFYGMFQTFCFSQDLTLHLAAFHATTWLLLEFTQTFL